MRVRQASVLTGMTVGVALNASDAPNQVDATVQLAQEAAAAGLRSVWFGQTFGADSPQLAAIVGREVPGLQVGTSAIPVFGRHPLLVSSQAQTAQAATHGRYHLGLALGTKLLTETGFGLPFERPIARLREFLTALRQLTETGTADFHGELLTGAHTGPDGVVAVLDDGEERVVDGTPFRGEHHFGVLPERGGVEAGCGDGVIKVAKRGGNDIVSPRLPDAPLRTALTGTPPARPARPALGQPFEFQTGVVAVVGRNLRAHRHAHLPCPQRAVGHGEHRQLRGWRRAQLQQRPAGDADLFDGAVELLQRRGNLRHPLLGRQPGQCSQTSGPPPRHSMSPDRATSISSQSCKPASWR